MSAIEQRARELLAAEWKKSSDYSNPASLPFYMANMIEKGDGDKSPAMRAIISALTPPEDSDQSLLELACTFETCIPFLPPTGQKNIAKAVEQLRHMAMEYVSRDDVLAAQDRAFFDGMSKCNCTPPEGYVLVSTELLEDLASEAESGIHQTVFVPAKRERRMQFVRDARALIAARPEVPHD